MAEAQPHPNKAKFYEWTNEVFTNSPFEPKIGNLLAMVTAMTLGDDGAASYFYFTAKKAGATDAELAAATDIAIAATGLKLYKSMPTDE